MSELQQEGDGTIAILILGLANAGKSTFINWVLETIGNNASADPSKRVLVREGPSAQTIQVEEVTLGVYSNQNVVLVDTPGFGHTDMSDADVLKTVTAWMKESYMRRVKVDAIIYVQDLSRSTRRQASAIQLDLDILAKLCGNAAIDAGLVTIATTNLGAISVVEVYQRLSELKAGLWSRIVGSCHVETILDQKANAGICIMKTIHRQRPAIQGLLRIQHELCVLDLPWFETSAGRCLRLLPDAPSGLVKELHPQDSASPDEREKSVGTQVPVGDRSETLVTDNRIEDRPADPNRSRERDGEERTDAVRSAGLADDRLHFQGRSSDVVLFVVGGEGAGKSTFINYILDEIFHPPGVRMKVDPGTLSACTREVTPVRLLPSDCSSDLGRAVLVDGPGLEDNSVSQHNEVISRLRGWFNKQYGAYPDMPKRGVMYIQDISRTPSTVDALNFQAATRLAKSIKDGDVSLISMKWGKRGPEKANLDQEAERLFKQQNFKGGSQAEVQFSKIEHCREGQCALSTVLHSLKRTDGQRRQALATLLSQLLPPTPRIMPPGGPKGTRVAVGSKPPDCVAKDSECDSPVQKTIALGLDDVRKGDIMIIVVGQMKAGKTTFVNSLVEEETKRKAVEDEMVSRTREPSIVVVDRAPIEYHALNEYLDNRRIVLVDTPGFNDTAISDDVVLMSISQWLDSAYTAGMRAGGVLYLRDITQEEWDGVEARTLSVLFKIRGQDVVNSLVTTKWGKLGCIKDGIKRAEELLSRHWKPVIDQGASVFHIQPSDSSPLGLQGTVVSPWDIIERTVTSMDSLRVVNRIVRLQDGLAKKKYFLPEGDAGSEIHGSLGSLLKNAKELQRRAVDGRLSLDAHRDEVAQLVQELDTLEALFVQRMKRRRDRDLPALFWNAPKGK